MMADAAKIVRKSEFATLRNVSAGRVTQWITAGHIGPDALVGQGRDARINVAVANAQLRERLDPSQRFGLNGITTRLEQPAPVAPLVETPAPPPPTLPLVDSVETRIKAEKLRQAELTTRRAEEADRLSRGVYILAKSARDENVRVAAKLFEAFDGALADFASALAAKYQIPQRDSLHLLRSELRRVRDRVSTEFAMAAAAEPETIEDTDTHDEPRS
jgi:hypothetical protein